jgi:hypothetical protein
VRIGSVALFLTCLIARSQALATETSFPKLEETGKALYENDRAASLATDRLMENGQLPSAVRGWLSLPSDGGWRVLFVEGDGDASCSRLSVLVDKNGAGPLGRSETCEPLTSEQRAMFLARQTALSALRARCSETYNTVVLPHEGVGAGWTVYLLAATQEPGKVVIGGHVRVLVREGGLGITDYQPLSKACLTLETPSSQAGKPAFLVVTHILDDHPIGLPPISWTLSERWIRCPECKDQIHRDGHDGGSLRSSRPVQFGWSWMKAKPSESPHASWI